MTTIPHETGEEPSGTPLAFSLRLRSLTSARQSVARLVREYGRGNVDYATYKGLLYGLQTLLSFMKAEREYQIEEKLDRIIDQMEKER